MDQDLEMIAEAQRQFDKRKLTSKERELEAASRAMRNANVSQAVQYVRSLGLHQMQVALLAEELGLNRKDVLGHFPKIGPSIRQRYAPAVTAEEVVEVLVGGETPESSPTPPPKATRGRRKK